MRILRLALLAMIALLVAGCGGPSPAAAVPTDQPVAVPTGQPVTDVTAAAAPATAAPVQESPAAPTAASSARVAPGLGISRASFQAHFEAAPLGFVFTDAPATDAGIPTVEGTSKTKGIKLRLIGPPEDVQEAQIQAMLGEGKASSQDALVHMLALLDFAVPGIPDSTTWLQPHLEKAIKEKIDTTIEGKRLITIITASEIKYMLLSVQRAP